MTGKNESPFDSVTFTWNGIDYTIAPDRMMGAIYRIEKHITFNELVASGGMKMGALAAAYASVLQYAGAPASHATAENVYAAMMAGSATGSIDQERIAAAVTGLLAMMLPTNRVLEKERYKPRPGDEKKSDDPERSGNQ